MTIPDRMPRLKAGGHPHPWDGACVMEYIALLTGETHTAVPSAVHPHLVVWGWLLNDICDDDDLRAELLMPLVPRLMTTSRVPTEQGPRIDARMDAAWRMVHASRAPLADRARYLAAEMAAMLDELEELGRVDRLGSSPAPLTRLKEAEWRWLANPFKADELRVLAALDAQLEAGAPAVVDADHGIAPRVAQAERDVCLAELRTWVASSESTDPPEGAPAVAGPV